MLTRQKHWNLLISLFIGIPAFFSFLFLGQSDLAHTVFSSYSIIQGHFLDFYDFNEETFVGNDYLPIVYLIFAAWMTPLSFLGLSSGADNFATLQLNSQELIWAKLGLVLVAIIASFVIKRIANQIWGDNLRIRSDLITIAAPITLLSVFALGQFDVIGVLFTLLGFERWLRNDRKWFVIYFAIAICFKYFSVIIFFILIILGRDLVKNKISQFVSGLLLVGVQILAFLSNEAFRENIFSQANRVLSLDSPIEFSFKLAALFVLTLVFLVWAHRRSEGNSQLDAQLAISLIIVFLSIFFIVIKWNPQWLLYLVPFWALAANYVRWPRIFILTQAIGFLGLVFMLANIWTNNLDESMAWDGLLAPIIPDRVLRLTDLYIPNLLILGVVLAYLSILLTATQAALASRRQNFVDIDIDIDIDTEAENLQLVGVLSLSFVVAFLIPILFSYVTPASTARQISNVVEYNRLDRLALGQFHSEVLKIPAGKSVTQSIPPIEHPGGSKLLAIEIDLFIGEKSVVDIQITQGDRVVGSKTATLDGRNPNSFPGFGGWTTVIVPIQLNELQERGAEIEIKTGSGQESGVWIDTERPENVQLRDAYGKLVSGSITLRLLK